MTVLFVPDSHAPWIDPRAQRAVLAWAKRNKPDRIIHLGDLYDGYLLSRFAKSPDLIDRRLMRKERAQGLALLGALRQLAPTTVLVGNHEARVHTRLSESPYLAWFFDGVPTVPVPDGVDVREHVRLGPVLAVHGFRSRSVAGTAALSLAGNSSVVTGHTHQLGLIWKDPKTFAMECGHIAKPAAPCFGYEPRARLGIGNWKQGFGWLDDEGQPHLEAI